MRVCIHIVELPRYGCNHEPLKSRKLEWPHLSVYIGNVLSLILTLSRFVDGKKIRSKFSTTRKIEMEKSSFILLRFQKF